MKPMCAGRARWRIENETFSTLKNQGDEFEHDFGYGEKNSATVFAALMMLAFAIAQIRKTCCPLFRAALAKKKRAKCLREDFRSMFMACRLPALHGSSTVMDTPSFMIGYECPDGHKCSEPCGARHCLVSTTQGASMRCVE